MERIALVRIYGLVNVTYKQLKYDKEKVIYDFRKNSVPYGDKFIDMFY